MLLILYWRLSVKIADVTQEKNLLLLIILCHIVLNPREILI